MFATILCGVCSVSDIDHVLFGPHKHGMTVFSISFWLDLLVVFFFLCFASSYYCVGSCPFRMILYRQSRCVEKLWSQLRSLFMNGCRRCAVFLCGKRERKDNVAHQFRQQESISNIDGIKWMQFTSLRTQLGLNFIFSFFICAPFRNGFSILHPTWLGKYCNEISVETRESCFRMHAKRVKAINEFTLFEMRIIYYYLCPVYLCTFFWNKQAAKFNRGWIR